MPYFVEEKKRLGHLLDRELGVMVVELMVKKKTLQAFIGTLRKISTVSCFLIAFHSHMNQIFFPSPFLKRRQMGSEVISGQRLGSLNCTLACLCIPRRDVTIIRLNGNRCRVRRDVASGARRAACQASGFAGDHLQCFVHARFTSGIVLLRRCQKSHPGT